MDTGNSTSLLSHYVTQALNLDIVPTKYITLKAADGEEMVVNGTSRIWLDFYAGKYERNTPATQKSIDVIVSSSLDGNEEQLISKADLFILCLLPHWWPY